jgi:hypothetical protein
MPYRSAANQHAVPGSAARRALVGSALVLVALLLMLKFYLLIGLREDLIQTHWRFVEDAATPLATTCFYVFLAELAASLALLGARCDRLSVASIRKLNFGLVLAGAMFALLALSIRKAVTVSDLPGWDDWGRPLAPSPWDGCPRRLVIFALAYASVTAACCASAGIMVVAPSGCRAVVWRAQPPWIAGDAG